MGKTKQQQRPKRKKLTNSKHDKQKMKEVLKKLAQNKIKNQKIQQKSNCITQMHIKNKKIRKNSKNVCEDVDQHEDQDGGQEEVVVPEVEVKKIVNIFAVDSYQAQKPVLVSDAPAQINSKMDEEVDLQSRARRVMGENFSMSKFGEKPMKIIEQQAQKIALSQDQNDQSTTPHPNLSIPTGNRALPRPKQLQQFRKKLPIFMKQQQIIETINTNLVTLICGETGSGKSTQLPQFLIQKNYQQLGKIGITQPRRLAAVALARRVAEEMGVKVGAQVAYQVRHDRKQSEQSIVKFMTDGILLKQMSSDPLLLEYSVIVIDQAHERKLNTDILIGLLSRLILLRYKHSQQNQKCPPLRLVIMSATLRIQDFQNKSLFNFKVPILKVEAKMFPVTIFHEKNTPENYVQCAVKKCLKIHKQLPPGDVLVFLTGKEEIKEMSLKLEMGLGRIEVEQKDGMDEEENDDEIKAEGEYIQQPVRKNSSGNFHPHITSYKILNLYSSLPPEQQSLIFQEQPKNCRKFILSTNIAETSLTVPNIRYVIDTGQEKYRYFDQVWKWNKGWGTKAMAMQRAGRAGRVMHGYCYRLYSAALFANIMNQYPEPEICRLPLQSVVLEVKAIGFKDVFAFPFPTPPQNTAIKQSLQNLLQVGAIQGKIQLTYTQPQPSKTTQTQSNEIPKPITHIHDNCQITELGRIISFIPLAPHLSKMLLLSHKLKLQKHVLLIVILLTVETIFKSKWANKNKMDQEIDEDQLKGRIKESKKGEVDQFYKLYGKYMGKNMGSDLFVAMNIAGEFMSKLHQSKLKNPSTNLQSHIHTISSIMHLSQPTMTQFFYNSDQILQIFRTLTSTSIDLSTYTTPTQAQYKDLLSLLLSTYHKNICRLQQNNKYIDKDRNVIYIHRMSVLYKQKCLFVGAVQLYEDDRAGKGIRRYMRYPFRVDDFQLLASFGRVREIGEYDWDGERVVAKASGELYGWQIPNLVIKQPKGQSKYYAFARFLLSGTITPSLTLLQQNNRLTSPISSIRPDNLQQKVQRLIMQFRKYEINDKNKLIEQFRKNKNYLQKQLKLWINVKNYQKVYQVLREAILKDE